MYRIGLATARNVIVRTTGGVINRPGLEFVNFQISMAHPSRFRRFRFNVNDTYMLEFGDQAMRVIRDDAYVLEGVQTVNSVVAGIQVSVGVTAHGWSVGQDIEFATDGSRLNGRRLRVGIVTDADHVVLVDIVTGQPFSGGGWPAFVSGTARRVYTLITPYLQADLTTLKFVQSADVLTITHPTYPEARLARTGDASWTLTNPTFAPTITAPTGLLVTPNTTGATIASYVVTATDATTGEESLPTAPTTITNANATMDNSLAWAPSPNALLYSIYKASNGVYGFIGTTPSLAFSDKNMAPALATTPPTAKNPFANVGDYPGCSTYYQQRQVRGGSNNAPDTLYYSRTANFYNYSTSTPSQADDAITSALVSREVNAIRHMVPVKDLLVFTAGGEWRINSSGNGFSASTMQQLGQSTWGCSHLEPIVVGLTTLFTPENQTTVRSFSYTYVSDAYQGNDLTLLSGHLFNVYPLVDWGYGRTPDPIVYGIRADGTATCFTFQEEQQVSAWTRWDTLGKFEAVDVVRPSVTGPDEVPYFGVQRTIRGYTVRYTERLHSRRFTDVRDCFFVDSGLSYDIPVPITAITMSNPVVVTTPSHAFTNGQQIDLYDVQWQSQFDEDDNETQPDQLNGRRFIVDLATATTFALRDTDGTGMAPYVAGGTVRVTASVINGLDHLEGQTVQALADGNVVSNLVVEDGSVTLPYPASRVHVGLKYISDVGTLDLETPQGTIQGKFKRVVAVTVRFDNSRGLFIGQNTSELEEIKQRQDEAMGDPTALFSGDKLLMLGSSWNEEGRVFLRQRYPLPMNILAIMPELDIES